MTVFFLIKKYSFINHIYLVVYPRKRHRWHRFYLVGICCFSSIDCAPYCGASISINIFHIPMPFQMHWNYACIHISWNNPSFHYFHHIFMSSTCTVICRYLASENAFKIHILFDVHSNFIFTEIYRYCFGLSKASSSFRQRQTVSDTEGAQIVTH